MFETSLRVIIVLPDVYWLFLPKVELGVVMCYVEMMERVMLVLVVVTVMEVVMKYRCFNWEDIVDLVVSQFCL